MIRKSIAQKISVKAKKKGEKKRIGPVPVSTRKTTTRRKPGKKVTSEVKKTKTQGKKPKRRIQTRKEAAHNLRKAKGPVKPASKQVRQDRTKIEKQPSVPRKKSKLTKAPAEARKSPPKIDVQTTIKKLRKRRAGETQKTKRTIARKPEKKVIAVEAGKPEASKPRATPSEKPEISRIKIQEPAKRKKSKTTEKPKTLWTTKPSRKKSLKEPAKAEQFKRVVISRRPKEMEEVSEPVTTAAEAAITAYHPVEVSLPPPSMETLPSEYGENGIVIMPVNPFRLFAFWEVRRETLNIFKGILHLRVYDVTGIDFTATAAHSFFDVVVSERIGKRYLDVSPEKEYVADIGILYNGIFLGIARSQRVSIPRAGIPGEMEFLPEGFDRGICVGY